MATSDSPLDRVLPLFDHTHDTATTALVVGVATLLAVVASWVVADFGVRFPAFAVTAIGAAYWLYRLETRREIVAGGLYMLAALIALTPVAMELHVLTVTGMEGVGSPAQHVLAISDLLLTLLFWVVAAVPAVAAYLLQNGDAVRARLGR
ncbi:hypothetical protein [Haloglomus halophilum]|uniref:hypothetical protein n=1 Tax=Haloglomus halophilum TaxID=2962672 RepID=UPI0020CA16A3|nr:hypothetical protein [Haloglomus halophilum]